MNELSTVIMKTSDEGAFDKAAEILRLGGLVAFPTETVYGLGGDALRADASERIYAAKGRPSDNPLIVHIADISAIDELALEVPAVAHTLMDAYWPGPMTLIFRKRACVPDETTGGLGTVAVRFPSHPDAQRLIRESGVYIAAPSANLSGRPSPTRAEHVIEDMNGRIDMILDGGPVGIGIESTIIDLTSDTPTILRPGYITEAMLRDLLGEVETDPHMTAGEHPKAPGMKYTHYAPKGRLTIVEESDTVSTTVSDTPGDASVTGNMCTTAARNSERFLTGDRVADRINALTDEAAAAGHRTAVITTRDRAQLYSCKTQIYLGQTIDSDEIAANLYDALRKCDELGADVIYCESYKNTRLGGAIMNRLIRAAGHRIIGV